MKIMSCSWFVVFSSQDIIGGIFEQKCQSVQILDLELVKRFLPKAFHHCNPVITFTDFTQKFTCPSYCKDVRIKLKYY